jgi:methyltransferase-like protein/cyclopropane fatty-acyl-phospholipid synthase-like methyltransferase
MATIEAANPAPPYSYDDVPYPSHPYDVTHPDHIYSLARLFKFPATLPDNARVLELGCASGGNLIPIAVQLPKAQFVGFDLSTKQIEDGNSTIAKLGLGNIKLVAKSFEELDRSFGQFDYILCHGVFSWVPDHVQKKIFEICRDRLTANGIAYISYNAYPGWFMRGMIREMMLHHVKAIRDPMQKVKQARALLSFIVESTEGQNTPYAQSLKQELEMLSKHSDAYLFHDHLETNNHPMFFFQFMDIAKTYNLQFMSETNVASMITSNLPAKAAESLSKLTNDLYHRSQYTDFITNRMFRQSLLCSATHSINRHIDETSINDAYFSGNFQFDLNNGKLELDPATEVSFKCTNGRTIKTSNTILKALMSTLAEAWPESLSMDAVSEIVSKKIADVIVVGEQQQVVVPKACKSFLLQLLIRGDIDFRFVEGRFTSRLSERPSVSKLARLQASTGAAITTLKHNLLNPDAITRLMIQAIDGTKTKADLSAVVEQLISSGAVKVTVQNAAQNVDLKRVHQLTVDRVLEQLRKHAMLQA